VRAWSFCTGQCDSGTCKFALVSPAVPGSIPGTGCLELEEFYLKRLYQFFWSSQLRAFLYSNGDIYIYIYIYVYVYVFNKLSAFFGINGVIYCIEIVHKCLSRHGDILSAHSVNSTQVTSKTTHCCRCMMCEIGTEILWQRWTSADQWDYLFVWSMTHLNLLHSIQR
jgi:hypothetical protein